MPISSILEADIENDSRRGDCQSSDLAWVAFRHTAIDDLNRLSCPDSGGGHCYKVHEALIFSCEILRAGYFSLCRVVPDRL